jgi:hypothetical protein
MNSGIDVPAGSLADRAGTPEPEFPDTNMTKRGLGKGVDIATSTIGRNPERTPSRAGNKKVTSAPTLITHPQFVSVLKTETRLSANGPTPI